MIGLFGGSFDPVHHGHLIIGQVARERLALEELRFLPAREQPFKRGHHRASPEHRLAMLSLALGQATGFSIERAELDRAGPSYTIDTLEELRARHPHAGFVLLLGADAATELPTWREGRRISQLARVVVFARPGSAVPDTPGVAQLIEVPTIDISATEVRRRIRERLSIRYWVPDAVAEYISLHRLYLDSE
jgi:nicotinate-nucleotide adenylyltransferase